MYLTLQNSHFINAIFGLGEDEKERERDLVNAEMIPLQATRLSFWNKLSELQYKMLLTHQENVQNHLYSSEPLEWPLMTRGIAYYVSSEHNVSTTLSILPLATLS